MIIELISNKYEGQIKLQEPLVGDNIDLPEELINVLLKSNGIKETMSVAQQSEPIEIGWIIYPYDEIVKETEFYREEYGLNGIVFASDGEGNLYYLLDGKVYEFNPIDDESELKSDSFEDFFS